MLCPHLGLQSIGPSTLSFSTHFQLPPHIFCFSSPWNFPTSISTFIVAASSQSILICHSTIIYFHLCWRCSCQGHQWLHIAKPNDLLCLSGTLRSICYSCPLSSGATLFCLLTFTSFHWSFSGSLQTPLISVEAILDAVFSTYIFSVADLIQPYGFKYHLYASDSPRFISPIWTPCLYN